MALALRHSSLVGTEGGGWLSEAGVKNHLESACIFKHTIGVTLGLAVGQQFPLFFLQPLPGCCITPSGTTSLMKPVLFFFFLNKFNTKMLRMVEEQEDILT